MKKWLKILIIVFCSLLVLAGAGFLWMYSHYKNPEQAFSDVPPVQKPQQDSSAAVEDEQPEGEQVVNILILGIDSNEEREQKNMGYRSDVMMLCQINFEKESMTLLSIPRDTWVEIEVLDKKTGEVKRTTHNRINAAYGVGGGGPEHFGPECAMATVSAFLSCDGAYDIPIHYYASIDMDGLASLVEAVDGVEVTLDRDLPGVGKKGETVMLDGPMADEYVRNRKRGGGGDTAEGRVGRQQVFVKALVERIKEKGAVECAPRLLSGFIQYGDTNLQLGQVLALAGFASDFDVDSTVRYTVQNRTDKEGHDKANMDELAAFIEENLVYGAGPAAAAE
ncbi:MAG: LCP family protein [Christensenellaceae bacterium]|nr:LCP family protein [Christensenellaceae bacterium]